VSQHLTGCFMTGRLYCTPRAMWKLSWFLRDFGYDAELLGKSEIDEKARSTCGCCQGQRITIHGISVLNFTASPGGPLNFRLRFLREEPYDSN